MDSLRNLGANPRIIPTNAPTPQKPTSGAAPTDQVQLGSTRTPGLTYSPMNVARSGNLTTGSPGYAALRVGLTQANASLSQGQIDGILKQSTLPNGQVDLKRALALASEGTLPVGQGVPQPGWGPTVSQPNPEWTVANRPLIPG